MTGEGLEINVTNMRDFAAVLWSHADKGREWDTNVNKAIELLTGGSKSAEQTNEAGEGSSIATIGTVESVEYHGIEVGKLQNENIPILVKYLKDARRSIRDAATGAAVIAEDFQGQDTDNAKATEQTYQDFGEAPPHGLYPGQ